MRLGRAGQLDGHLRHVESRAVFRGLHSALTLASVDLVKLCYFREELAVEWDSLELYDLAERSGLSLRL